VIDQGESGGGIAGERDIVRIGTGVATKRRGHRIIELGQVVLEHPLLHRQQRILVESPAKPLDGITHRPGMGGQVEQAEVDVGGIDVELLPHRSPVARVGQQSQRRTEPLGEAHHRIERTRRGRERSAYY
jgi:hypothetical protein